jgi:peptide/nickel transport system permease protein
MGTDNLGRDVLSRVIWGARLSLYVGLASVLVGITIGSLWGIFTGYYGGIADTSSQRIVDCVMALPPIILALSLMAAVGQSVNNVILALTILLTPDGGTDPARGRAGRLGQSPSSRPRARRAPRTCGSCCVTSCPTAWRPISSSSRPTSRTRSSSRPRSAFLGVGAPPDEPSWGGMLTAGTQAMETAPWLIFFPGVAISLAVFALNLLGDAIRDIADPRLRGGLG